MNKFHWTHPSNYIMDKHAMMWRTFFVLAPWVAVTSGAPADQTGSTLVDHLLAISAKNDSQIPWYHQAIVYQLYPRSFQDSDGDGVGDLKGILSRVDYLASLGIDAVWLNPIQPSPNKDFGYDITNYTAVNPEYGSMEDFKKLVQALKQRGIKVVMDYVPNHTSNMHDWFVRSSKGEDLYKDFYIWQPVHKVDGTNKPPNNWTGQFGGSMWKYNEARDMLYLHQFLDEQPDLNYRCDAVVTAMEEVLKFWLDQGVSGFRMDTVATLIESDTWADEPYNGGDPNQYGSYSHTMTTEQPETYEILRKFKKTLEDYSKENNREPMIMMTESYSNDPHVLRRYYGTENEQVTTFPFNFLAVMRMGVTSSAKDWADTINTWYYHNNDSVMPGYWAQPNFVLGNHDQHRLASRFVPEHTDILNMVQLTLKGTAVVYYGDELGLVDTEVRRDQGKDIQGIRAAPGQFYSRSRDPERGPMPWNSSSNAAFTTGKPWLPLPPDYVLKNVAAEEKANASHLKVFRALAKLRKSATLQRGDCEVTYWQNILILYRTLMDNPSIITVVNLDNMEHNVNLQKLRPTLPTNATLLVKSVNYSLNSSTILTNNINLPPLSGVVLTTFV